MGYCKTVDSHGPEPTLPVLAVVATALEAAPLEGLGPEYTLLVSGVGKASAAAATASALATGTWSAVLSLGIGGSLPGRRPLPLGAAVLATRSRFADEGVATPNGFIGLDRLGFSDPGADDHFAPDPTLLTHLRTHCDREGIIATVSTCSGTDARAAAVAERTGAVVEAMEGAAVGLAAARSGVRFAEVRVISNTTGDRDRQVWAMDRAKSRLAELARALRAADLR